MVETLNLNVILTPPPTGSPPEMLASVSLQAEAFGLSHSGDLLHNPLSAEEGERLRWYLEEYWQWPYEQFRERAQEIEELLPELGKSLYRSLFGSPGAQAVVQAWRLQSATPRQISIVSNMPRVLSLPWELLHDEQGFLALRSQHPVSIVRRLSQRELPALPTPFEPPLRILLVTARPDDAGFVDPRSIARELLEAVAEQVEEGAIALEFLRPPTLPALRARLSDAKRPAIHVLHFDGHGAFGEEPLPQDGLRFKSRGIQQGLLAFENEEGQEQLVTSEELAQVLQHSGVRLAVFNACQSAVGRMDDVFSSVAARLIQGGIDAVVAMSASVLVASATRYVEAFYRCLAAGVAVPMAHERARQALHDDARRHLARRYQDEEGEPVRLRDWWLPHFYQQRPLLLQPVPATTTPSTARRTHKKPQPGTSPSVLSETMPAQPRHGFGGRASELLQLERALLHKKLVVIHGFGGMGKTALAREAAEWFTRTGLYQRACFISFEQGGDATLVLSLLGTFLGIYDASYNPNDSPTSLARIGRAVRRGPTLLIADNLESILPAGEAALEPAELARLWEVLLALRKLGVGVLLTTRDITFAESRLAAGKEIVHLPLHGLFAQDAYLLASRVLTDLGIDRARAPYADLRDLLAELDHHPLAIQLVLPALRERSLATIRADFAHLLPAFVDDSTSGRNRSLLASLDYSLRRLRQEQRAYLARLALFEGGASEDDLLAITQIPPEEWATLRRALEQALAAMPTPEDGGLTQSEYLQEIGRAQDEQGSGKVRAAFARLTRLLSRIQALPDGADDGPGSYSHCYTLQELGYCLQNAGQLEAASGKFHEALALLEMLLEQQPEDRSMRRQRANLLLNLGTVLSKQGQYAQAQAHYEHALQEYQAVNDTLNEAVTLGQLGSLALRQRDFSQARSRYVQALEHFRAQGDPARQAAVWHNLGNVAEEQQAWAEAERCYRESLALRERVGNIAGAADTCNQLANVAVGAGRPAEAEGWYKGALERIERVEPGSMAHARYLNNLASLLMDEVRAGRVVRSRLVEARHYAEQAQRIKEQPGISADIWNTYGILAKIAELEEQPEAARDYRRKEHESYAAFAGNRYQIDQQHADLIEAIAAAARGDAQVQATVAAALPTLEQRGWHVSYAVQRMWKGERDWQTLVERLGRQDALLILRVLETLASPPDAPPSTKG